MTRSKFVRLKAVSKPRIIAGSARGRTLETPKAGTRPSPARLREALFNILNFRERGSFLDLYSGSGAIGLEAASRGWQATCVELSRPAANVLRRNAKALSLDANVLQADALKVVKDNSYDIVFAAPPYSLNLQEIFQTILDADAARPNGLYIFQHPTGLELTLTYNGELALPDTRKYGSNSLSFVDRKKAVSH